MRQIGAKTGIAFVGCGYVADFYMRTLAGHANLSLVGAFDHDPARASRFSAHHGVEAYRSLDQLLGDERVAIVANLTSPRSHFAISRAALEAGKHVYSEKPLGMRFEEAHALVELARGSDRLIASAPCSILGEAAQTLWKALRDRRVGRVRVVYAEMDDGMVHRMPYRRWVSESGAPWPYEDEFAVGCTLEHAGYYVTWLTAFFGPAETVTAFASCQIPEKTRDVSLDEASPDFSVACIRFVDGVVARLTCSLLAPHDHSLRIVGDEGVLATHDCWHYGSPVYLRRALTIRRKTIMNPIPRRIRLVRRPPRFQRRASAQMDFARGLAEMAEALAEGRACRLSPEYSLHNTEIVLAIQQAARRTMPYRLTTTFVPPEPMPWAR